MVANKKLPFDLPRMLNLIRAAMRPYPKAALFELAGRGYDQPFEILVACVLSIRTYDEVSLPAALRLLGKARTPKKLKSLQESEIAELIHGCSFAYQKAGTLLKIATILDEKRDFVWNFENLTDLPGIGPKCAGLILGIALGEPTISVDIHVHRVTNRWGYVRAPTPEKTLAQLRDVLPRKFWIEINALLVPFGKHVCRGSRPDCPNCPVLAYCRQVGVPASIRDASRNQTVQRRNLRPVPSINAGEPESR